MRGDAPKATVEAGTVASSNGATNTVELTGPAFGNTGGSPDVERWACVQTLRGHVHDVLGLSWSSCGGMLASASVDNSVMGVAHKCPTVPQTIGIISFFFFFT